MYRDTYFMEVPSGLYGTEHLTERIMFVHSGGGNVIEGGGYREVLLA